MAILARLIIVHGMVQGVGFRYFVQRTGSRMGLTGNVRNLADSTVEVVVEGKSGQLNAFTDEVRKGPAMARVDRLEIQEIPVSGCYTTFMIEGW
jgi:acylphosphatase